MNGVFLAALLAYFALLLALSFFVSRRAGTLEDFFLASRRLSSPLVFLTVTASWIGAASMLVALDEARINGISSVWVMAAPAVVTVLIFAFVLARPIRRLSIVTLSDLVEARYGPLVRHMASILIVWYMVLLAATQMVALGKFLSPFLGMPYILSLMIGTLVVLIYAAAGGLFSVVVTDGFQLCLLVAGIVGLFIWSLGGGQADPAGSLGIDALARGGLFAEGQRNLLIFLSFTLAWTISPITWQRIQGARTEGSARTGLLMSGGVLALLYAALIAVGMSSPPGISGGASLLPSLIGSMKGSALSLALFVAVLAAIMSTMDTAVNTGAMSLAHDIMGRWGSRSRREGGLGRGRLATLLVGASAFLVATRFQSILTTLGLASEIMAEGLFIPGMAMIFLKGRYPRAGLLSLGAGGGFSILSFLNQVGVQTGLPVWPYSLPWGLGLCGAGFVIGALLDGMAGRGGGNA